jgi:hypothetical protein
LPAVQHQFAFARPLAVRVRSVRRPFRPSAGEGAYRLPRDVQDRLAAALAPFRNREAAFTLATFLARFWSVPGRVAGSFPIDRRALADHDGLELTEARVRGAIQTLEAVGFLERALASGSTHRATEDGLRRKPVQYVFGSEYAPAFLAANKRAQAARGGLSPARRPLPPAAAPRPSVALPEARPLNSPKYKSEAETKVIMGEITKPAAAPAQNLTPLPRLSPAALRVFGKPKPR